jgi:predicted anti-sigma-YlaC factor YlaD
MWREALSARLDGETGLEGLNARTDRSGDGDAAVDAHLAGCAGCRAWYADAAFITRLARVGGETDVHDGVPDSVLAATPRPTRARLARGSRGLLALLGAGQVLLAVAELGGPMATGDSAVMHMTHEFVAWNAAIGAGFLFIAWRRTRPSALLPLLTAFVAVLTVLSFDDLVQGMVGAGRLASHALLFAGYAVVVAMSRPSMTFDLPPGVREPAQPSAWRLESDEAEHETPAGRDAPDNPAASAAPDNPAAFAAPDNPAASVAPMAESGRRRAA